MYEKKMRPKSHMKKQAISSSAGQAEPSQGRRSRRQLCVANGGWDAHKMVMWQHLNVGGTQEEEEDKARAEGGLPGHANSRG